MKVIQICGAQHAGGAEAHYLRFCEELNKYDGIEVISLVRKGSWLEEQLKKTTIKTYTLGFRSSLDLLTAYQIKTISHNEKSDIIQCWMNRAASLTPKKSHGFKIGRLGGYYSLKNYKNMDFLVGATEDICKHIKTSGWHKDKVSCIPNFVNLPKSKNLEQCNLLKESLGLANKKVIFTPARLHPVKGLDTAIRALNLLSEEYVYLITGAGPDEKKLKDLATHMGVQKRVIFAGWQNNISPYCYISDIFLVPSRHEPFGSVLLEAWSHQVPLVTSDSQGALAITINKKNSLIFKKDNIDELVEKITTIEKNSILSSQIVKNGLDELIKKYTSKPVLNKYIELYTSKELET